LLASFSVNDHHNVHPGVHKAARPYKACSASRRTESHGRRGSSNSNSQSPR
jgi:hypothetical protein